MEWGLVGVEAEERGRSALWRILSTTLKKPEYSLPVNRDH